MIPSEQLLFLNERHQQISYTDHIAFSFFGIVILHINSHMVKRIHTLGEKISAVITLLYSNKIFG